MRTTKIVTFLILVTLFASCDKDDPIVLDPVASKTVSNLYAPLTSNFGEPDAGPFVLFDFETGAETTDLNAWDIGFRGTAIIVNGGVSLGSSGEPDRTGNAAAYITTGGLASVTEVDLSLFTQDTTTGYAIPKSSGQGWYNYNFMNNVISPITGVVLVFKTTEGKYAKVEIESYYENAPMDPTGVDVPRYYTFSYVYQPNDNVTTF